mgnify:CR=1 FL=1
MRNGKSRTEYMELNTINKTGTWSETADRINSNFSKISIEVEEIKQNGGGGSGGGGDVTNADHATSAYTLDKNTPVLDWFLSALNDDDAQGIINFLKGLKISGNLVSRIVKQGDKDVTYTDEDVMSALRVMIEIENSVEKMKEIFLRKDVADSTKYLLSLLGGVLINKYAKFGDFVTGVSGGYIDEKGDMEMGSGVFRKRLFVPEIAYNRTTYFKGRMVNSPGGGCSVLSYVDNGDGTYTITPDLTVHADWQEMVAPVGPSASYWLDSPVSVINFTSTGTPSPSGFLVTCKQNVAGNVSTCSTLYLAARKYNGNWLAHVGATLSNQISVPATAGYTQFAVRAYKSVSDANAWNNNFVAEKGVGVANDGTIGATGATGVRSEQTIYRILDSNGVPRRPKVRGVRKIFVTIEEDVAAILDKEQSVSLYVNEAIRFYHGNRH